MRYVEEVEMRVRGSRSVCWGLVWVGLVVGALLVGGCEKKEGPSEEKGAETKATAGGEAEEASEAPGEVGEAMPELEAQTIEGETVELQAAGEATLVNLWATWCAPCIAELPEFKRLEQTWGDRGLRLVGVSVEAKASKKRVEKFVEEHEPAFQVRFGPSKPLLEVFGAKSVPATYLYDADGKLVWSHGSMLEEAQVEQLEKHLKKLVGSAAN